MRVYGAQRALTSPELFACKELTMPVTNYYTVNGALIGEKTAGGTRTDYLTDALGNVTATVNQSGQVVNTYRYKPYGAQLAKTGAGADPAFRWVGAQGYRQTGRKYSDVYVRARHYGSAFGRWTTVDPKWPSQPAYGYVNDDPLARVDPSGPSSHLTPRLSLNPTRRATAPPRRRMFSRRSSLST